jgi:2-C-methyl-D-erythritol 2,4-cyclodiphosphate synthase
MRVGLGFDLQAYDPGRVLMLGGVKIPGVWGLRGRSDADVLLRALIDGLLGAAGMGGIEDHFPEDEDRYEGVPSAALLAEALTKVQARGLRPAGVDLSLIVDRVELDAYRGEICTRVAALLGLPEEDINVKRRPHHGLGGPGHKDGIGALALVTLEKLG